MPNSTSDSYLVSVNDRHFHPLVVTEIKPLVVERGNFNFPLMKGMLSLMPGYVAHWSLILTSGEEIQFWHKMEAPRHLMMGEFLQAAKKNNPPPRPMISGQQLGDAEMTCILEHVVEESRSDRIKAEIEQSGLNWFLATAAHKAFVAERNMALSNWKAAITASLGG